MIRILIVDPHDLVCMALETRLRTAVGLEVVGSTNDYTEASHKAGQLQPDVILLETKAPQGLGTLDVLCQKLPQCAIIVLTSYADSHEEDQTRRHGAARYLLKTLNTKELVQEIRAVTREKQPAILAAAD